MRKLAGSACIVLVGLGQSISGWQSPFIGFAFTAIGLCLGLAFIVSDERVRQRFPYAIVRRTVAAPDVVSGREDPPQESQLPPPTLKQALQDQLRRGKRIRTTASITPEGSSGTIEIWEHEVAVLLEDANRHDFLTRFEDRTAGDRLRSVASGPWSTRARMDRRLRTVSQLIRELPD